MISSSLTKKVRGRLGSTNCAPDPMAVFHGDVEENGWRYLFRDPPPPPAGVEVAVGAGAVVGVGVRVGVFVGVRVGVFVGVRVGVAVAGAGVGVGAPGTGVFVEVGGTSVFVGVGATGVDVAVGVALGTGPSISRGLDTPSMVPPDCGYTRATTTWSPGPSELMSGDVPLSPNR
jgi:hypothetical protein